MKKTLLDYIEKEMADIVFDDAPCAFNDGMLKALSNVKRKILEIESKRGKAILPGSRDWNELVEPSQSEKLFIAVQFMQ